MHMPLDMLVTIICSVLASSGLWAYLMKRSERKDAKIKLLVGLAHDRIIHIGKSYIQRGWVSMSDYDDLVTYLYEPYKAAGGDGAVEKIMIKVKELPIKEEKEE